MKHVAIALGLLLGGCASAPDMADLGGGRFIVSRSAMTGSSPPGEIRAQALQQATDECRKARRIVQVESETESEPWYLPGNYRRLEITFRCVPGPTN